MGTEKIREMVCLSCERRLKELGLGSLAKQREREDLLAYHKYFRGMNTSKGKDCSSYKKMLPQD